MKPILLLIPLIASTVWAETMVVPFKQPEGFPLTMRLVLPKAHSSVLSHKSEDGFDRIMARINDDRERGMVVEAVDAGGKRIWSHDFGYNLSGAPGCSVGVSFHPKLNAMIISYHGYKWNHAHKLLFVEGTPAAIKVREYPHEAPEIRALLKTQSGYSVAHRYWIHPARFAGSRIVFSCIALEPPGSRAPHPLAQDIPWFDVTASIRADFKLTPEEVSQSH